ncbi:hypothetical protein AB1Y20_012589 [Prymnesium parvum]|uniref:Uncharacterized protein n=1 Tax=Prymnesium parvum TaxID=97485 RepID=A0AB34IL46_PRYPA
MVVAPVLHLLSFLGLASALRLLPSPATATCLLPPRRAHAVAAFTEEERKRIMDIQINGVDAGGWDNDEYLQSTKAPPSPPDDGEILRQAKAYLQMLKEKGMRPRPDVVELVEKLEGGASFDQVEHLDDGNMAEHYVNSVSQGGRGQSPSDLAAREYEQLSRRPPPPPPRAPPPPPPPAAATSAGGVASASSYASLMGAPPPPPLAATPPPPSPLPPRPKPPPPAATSTGGVASASSYASLMGASPPPPLAATPPPPPLPPPPKPPPPPQATAAAASAPPLPDKDPAELRLQYKAYLQTCIAQERQAAQPVVDLIRRLNAEKPPTAKEAEEASELLREAMVRLEAATDLSLMPAADRDALLTSLIRALAVVNAETPAAPSAPSASASAPPPPFPPPSPPRPSPSPPAVTSAGGVQSGSSYASLMGGAPPPSAASRPAPPPSGPAASNSLGSTYYVEGMDAMSPEEYRQALGAKLKAEQAKRMLEKGPKHTGHGASDSYMAWLENSPRSDAQ